MKPWFIEKISKIDKPIAKLTEREKTKISKIKGAKGDMTEIQKVITEYFENLHSNRLGNVEEMDAFLHQNDQPILYQQRKSKLISSNEI